MVKLKKIKTLPVGLRNKKIKKRVVKRIKKAFPLATSALGVDPIGLTDL